METGMYIIIYTMSTLTVIGIIGLIVGHFMKKNAEKESEQGMNQAI